MSTLKIIFFSSIIIFSNSAYSNNWYIGAGIGNSNHKYTLEDLEISTLDNLKSDFTVNGYKLFTGYRISENFSIEGGYIDLGKSSISGSSSSGGNTDNITAYEEYYGLNLSGVASIPLNDRLSFMTKGGIMKWENHSVSDISGSGQVLENQNDSNNKFDGTVFTYGVGIESNIINNYTLRIEHEIFKDIFSDYIDNINNGYIKKDINLTSMSLIYDFENKSSKNIANSPWYMGVSYGKTKTNARLSGGQYNGPIWNLKTNTRYATDVSGTMSDDKQSQAYKTFLGYKFQPNLLIEAGYIDLGIAKSKSSENGITGGGNELTGSLTAQTDGLFLSGLLKKDMSQDLSAFLKSGILYWQVDSEIYNNLDFNGIGGNRRGWIESDNGFSPVLGAGVDYDIGNKVKLRTEFERFFNVGTNDTTGKGDIDSLSVGIMYNF